MNLVTNRTDRPENQTQSDSDDTPKWYDYEYEGEWNISNLETDEFLRTETTRFVVTCEYPPSVWNKMEEDNTDEFCEIMVESYSDVLDEDQFDYEIEYHEGNEDYWRVNSDLQNQSDSDETLESVMDSTWIGNPSVVKKIYLTDIEWIKGDEVDLPKSLDFEIDYSILWLDERGPRYDFPIFSELWKKMVGGFLYQKYNWGVEGYRIKKVEMWEQESPISSRIPITKVKEVNDV